MRRRAAPCTHSLGGGVRAPGAPADRFSSAGEGGGDGDWGWGTQERVESSPTSGGDANQATKLEKVNSGAPSSPALLERRKRKQKGWGWGSGEAADLCLHFSKYFRCH